MGAGASHVGRDDLCRRRWGGQLKVLKRVREDDCSWDDCTWATAARCGHLWLPRLAREHDCPWGTTNLCQRCCGQASIECLCGRGSKTARGA